MSKKKSTAIDLFSGCGGLTLGLKQAGFRVLGAVEMDPLAVETYKKNHRGVYVWPTDIRKLAASRVLEALRLSASDLDLLAGCPPCQGFSRITTLNGKYRQVDDRNNLVFEFLRFVRVLRPKAVLLENVPGLAKNRRFRKLCSALRRLGYTLNIGVLDAADYGVPQRRRRLVLVGTIYGAPILAEQSANRVSVREAFRKLRLRPLRDPLHKTRENRTERIRALIRRIPKNGGSRLDLGVRHQLDCHRTSDGFKDVYGRMAWGDVAPTITGGCCNPSKGRFTHPSKARCITLREAALLQSFPASYQVSLRRGKFAVAQMIGNALPPEFVRRHAVALRAAILRGIAQENDDRHRR